MSYVTIKFSGIVTFTEGTGANGCTITHDNGGAFTLSGSGMTGSNSDTVLMEGDWDYQVDRADVVNFDYDGGGDFADVDAEAIEAFNSDITNCEGGLDTPLYAARVEVAVVPTEPYDTGCFLKVLTANNPSTNPIKIECNGIEFNTDGTGDVLLTMAQYGHAWHGECDVTGLTFLKHYPWTVTQGSFTDSGSCNRLAKSGEEHSMIMLSCDNNTNLTNHNNENPDNVIGNWDVVKDLYENGSTFISMMAGLDDYSGYVDSKLVDDTSRASCTQLVAALTLQDGGDADDVSLAWLGYYGCLGAAEVVTSAEITQYVDMSVHWGRELNRQFCRKNIPRKTIEGDHEFERNDIGFGSDATGTVTPADLPNTRWETYQGTLGEGQLAVNAMVNVSGRVICDGGTLDGHANHWVITNGNIRLFAMDHITNGTGDKAGGDEIPASQMTQVYTQNQLDDIRAEISSEVAPFNLMCMATGMMYCASGTGLGNANLAQNPWYNHMKAEHEYLLTNSVDGFAVNNNANGVAGVLVAVSGDLHRGNVLSYTYDAHTGNTAYTFEHWHTGSMNGSLGFRNVTGLAEGDTYNHTNTLAHATLLHDLQRHNDYIKKQHSFLLVKDLPNKAAATMRMQRVGTNGKIEYTRDYTVGSNSGVTP